MITIKEEDKEQGQISIQSNTDKKCTVNPNHTYMLVVRDKTGKLAACTCLTCFLKSLVKTPELDEMLRTVAMSQSSGSRIM
jgi:hypothetical protein